MRTLTLAKTAGVLIAILLGVFLILAWLFFQMPGYTPPLHLKGHVYDGHHRPAPAVRVSARVLELDSTRTRPETATTDREGAYRLVLNPAPPNTHVLVGVVGPNGVDDPRTVLRRPHVVTLEVDVEMRSSHP